MDKTGFRQRGLNRDRWDDDRDLRLDGGRAKPTWVAAIATMGLIGACLMFAPLYAIARRHAVVSPALGSLPDQTAANILVGVRGDRLDTIAVAASRGFFARRLAHRRLNRNDLRSYIYVRATPSEVREDAYQDSVAQGAVGATPISGLAGLHRAEPRGVAINATNIAKTERSSQPRQAIVMQVGDKPAALLDAAGLTTRDATAIASLLEADVANHGAVFAPGDVIDLSFVDAAAQAERSPSQVTATVHGRHLVEVARNDSGTYAAVADDGATIENHPDAVIGDASLTAGKSGASVRHALDVLVEQGMLDSALVADIVRICARDVDLNGPSGPTDFVSLLFATAAADSRSTNELAYVSIGAGGQRHRFYRYADGERVEPDYFDESGRAAEALLLRKPVAAGRLGDGFGWRIHPVLGDRRFHEGVDYAAPFGSPIVAAGAGIVEAIDVQWGYGKYIRIKHDQGYETTYAHVSGYPTGIAVGARVHQGQPIAFIGSTGLSTGPHLYYEVRVNGRDVDPLRVRLPGHPTGGAGKGWHQGTSR